MFPHRGRAEARPSPKAGNEDIASPMRLARSARPTMAFPASRTSERDARPIFSSIDRNRTLPSYWQIITAIYCHNLNKSLIISK